jgi:hypothetical protein
MQNSTEIISAIAALSKIAEIRQFELKEDFDYLIDSSLVREINAATFQATGIDIINAKKKLSFDDIEKYEEYLDGLMTKALPRVYSSQFLGDELNLLLDAQAFPLESFRSLNFELKDMKGGVKEIFKGLGYIAPSILPIIKNAERVEQIGDNETFFSVSRIEVKSKIIFVLFQISIGARAEYSLPRNNTNDFKITKELIKKFKDEKFVNVVSCFLFSHNSPLLESPTRMFLHAIDKYGEDMMINGRTQKFYLETVTSDLMIEKGAKVLFPHALGEVETMGQIKFTPTGFRYRYAYGIQPARIIRDYKRGILL